MKTAGSDLLSLAAIRAGALTRAQAFPESLEFLVLIPVGTRVGRNFAGALSDAILERTLHWYYEPARARIVGQWRTYCLSSGPSTKQGCFLSALLDSLEGFEMLRVAQVYVADARDGVLRRVIAAEKMIRGGSQGGAR